MHLPSEELLKKNVSDHENAMKMLRFEVVFASDAGTKNATGILWNPGRYNVFYTCT
jgi:hypothetical protein